MAAVLFLNLHFRWLLPLVLVVLGLFTVVYEYLVPLWKNYIELNDVGIAGHIDGKNFEFPWDVIDAIQIAKGQNQPWTICITSKGEFTDIIIRWLDEKEVYKQLSNYVDPKVLDIATWKQIVDKNLQEQINTILANLNGPINFGCYAGFQWTGIAGAIVFLIFGLLSLNSATPGAAYISFPLAIIGMILFVQYHQTMVIDLTGITKHSFFGTDFMEWNEVTELQTCTGESRMVLLGCHKHLVIAELAY